MGLQSNGSISLNDVAGEFGGSTPHSLDEYYGAANGVPTSGAISLADFYGMSAIPFQGWITYTDYQVYPNEKWVIRYGPWTSIAAGGGVHVAISYGSGRFMYSMDPAAGAGPNTWTLGTLPGGLEYYEDITYGNGRFVVVGGWGNQAYISAISTDGINWTMTTQKSRSLRNVIYAAGKFYAVSEGSTDPSRFVRSDDGLTWTATNSNSVTNNGDSQWTLMAHGGGRFVAINSRTNNTAYSDDGYYWYNGATTLPNSYWTAIAYGDGKFVAIGSGNFEGNNKIAYSYDGITWYTKLDPTQDPNDVFKKIGKRWSAMAYGRDKFIVISGSDHDQTMYSSDGINWTLAPGIHTEDYKLQHIVFDGEKFVAVGSEDSADEHVAVSYTGIPL